MLMLLCFSLSFRTYKQWPGGIARNRETQDLPISIPFMLTLLINPLRVFHFEPGVQLALAPNELYNLEREVFRS